METNEEDLIHSQKVSSISSGSGILIQDDDAQDVMIHQDDDQDDIIHHDPVELGGGPGLQLLSQPESEVVNSSHLKDSPKRQRDLAPI